MEDRTKTKVAIGIIIFTLVIAIGGGVILFTKKKTISPIPEDTAITIMFVTPTAMPIASPSATVTIKPTVKP